MSGAASAVVIDIGGSNTRVALYADGCLVSPATRFPTPSPRRTSRLSLSRAQRTLLDRVAAEADRLRARSTPPPAAVGVGLGAVVDAAGVVRNASTLWLEPAAGFDFAGALASRLPWARVTVLNDVAAAAWNYRALGRFLLLTVSTGVAVRVFDDALPFEYRVVAGEAGLGGEMGHTVVEPALVEELLGPARAAALGRAAAAGEPAAREALERLGLPWCECGTVADLCSYASGPAVERAARALARAQPAEFQASLLGAACDGDPDRITTRLLARSARRSDPFSGCVLRSATRHLASRLLQLCADLGLDRAVVVGGLPHGIGEPWFAALCQHLGDLLPDAGWFTGWTPADAEAILHVPDDANVCGLVGMGRYLDALAESPRELRKPTGESRVVVVRAPGQRCGRQQFATRTVFAGICSTDLQILRGDRGCEPGVLGHECVAEVTEVGAEVRGLRPGDVIGINPNHPLDDHEKIGHNLPGVLRERAVWDGHLLERGQVVKLPRDGRAEWVLLELLAGVVRAQEAMRLEWPGRTVLVAGAGVAGLLHALLALHRGAARVLIANRSADRLGLARRAVPAARLLPLTGALPTAVRRATCGLGADAVIVAVTGGAGPSVLDGLWETLADDGVVHLFGGFPPGAAIRVASGEAVDASALRARSHRMRVRTPAGRAATLAGTRGGRGCDYRAAVDLACRGLDLRRLVTHVASLEAAPAVMDELSRRGTVGGEAAMRVVVDVREPGVWVRRAADHGVPALR